MATATITGTTSKVITGGSALDPLTLTDIATASNSGLTSVLPNIAIQTNPGLLNLSLPSGTFSDLTGGILVFDNVQNGQDSIINLSGNVTIGSASDFRPFTIYLGEKSLRTTFSSVNFINPEVTFNLFNTENRIILRTLLDQVNSGFSEEPGARSFIRLTNNLTNNSVRVSIFGVPYSDDVDYALPNPTGFKPNGSILVRWSLGPLLLVRDIEIRDGYIDWRPTGVWSPPTQGVFISKTWIKFLGSTNFSYADPLIFGNANDSFEIVVGEDGQTGSYLLHGLYPTGTQGRVVYNNFKGLSWATQLALYSEGRVVRVENHLSLSYSVINSLGAGEPNVKIIVYKKDPVYPAGGLVNFNGLEASFEIITNATGQGNVGNDNGDLLTSICVEAFAKTGSGGNVDGAYANPAHSSAQYANNEVIAFAVLKYGKTLVFKTDFDTALAGQVGDGKQSLGVTQLNDDLLISEDNAELVSAYVDCDTANKAYDLATLFLINNYDGETQLILTRDGNIINAGSHNVIIDPSAPLTFNFTNNTITLKTTDFVGSITTTGTLTLSSANLTGDVIATDIFAGTNRIEGDVTGRYLITLPFTATNQTISNVVANAGTGRVTITGGSVLRLENASGSAFNLFITDSITPLLVQAGASTINIATILTVTSRVAGNFTILASDSQGNLIQTFTSTSDRYVINVGALTSLRIATWQAEHYTTFNTVVITGDTNIIVNPTRVQNIKVVTSSDALFAMISFTTVLTNNVSTVLATFDTAPVEDITQDGIKNLFVNFFSSQMGLNKLLTAGITSEDFFQTTQTGINILLPTLQIVPADGITDNINTLADIDFSAAQVVSPSYILNPVNDSGQRFLPSRIPVFPVSAVSNDIPTVESIYNYFIGNDREDVFKATGFATPAGLTSLQTALTTLNNNVSTITAEQIYNYFIGNDREDVFKATGFQPAEVFNIADTVVNILFNTVRDIRLVEETSLGVFTSSFSNITNIVTAGNTISSNRNRLTGGGGSSRSTLSFFWNATNTVNLQANVLSRFIATLSLETVSGFSLVQTFDSILYIIIFDWSDNTRRSSTFTNTLFPVLRNYLVGTPITVESDLLTALNTRPDATLLKITIEMEGPEIAINSLGVAFVVSDPQLIRDASAITRTIPVEVIKLSSDVATQIGNFSKKTEDAVLSGAKFFGVDKITPVTLDNHYYAVVYEGDDSTTPISFVRSYRNINGLIIPFNQTNLVHEVITTRDAFPV